MKNITSTILSSSSYSSNQCPVYNQASFISNLLSYFRPYTATITVWIQYRTAWSRSFSSCRILRTEFSTTTKANSHRITLPVLPLLCSAWLMITNCFPTACAKKLSPNQNRKGKDKKKEKRFPKSKTYLFGPPSISKTAKNQSNTFTTTLLKFWGITLICFELELIRSWKTPSKSSCDSQNFISKIKLLTISSFMNFFQTSTLPKSRWKIIKIKFTNSMNKTTFSHRRCAKWWAKASLIRKSCKTSILHMLWVRIMAE